MQEGRKLLSMKTTTPRARNSIFHRSSRHGFVLAFGAGLVMVLIFTGSNSANGEGRGNVRPAMIGGGPDSVATHLHYPPKAKAAKDEAAIPFYCEVGATGKAAFISLFGPDDKTQFRVALLKALETGRFEPAMSGGKCVPVILGGTAFFMFRGNQPIIAISLSTAEKEKTAALSNYIQPQMLTSNLEFRRKVWYAHNDPDLHFRLGMQPVYPRAAVLAEVDAQGNLISTKVIGESPPGTGYGPWLVKGFQGAKFIPAFSNGKPVAGRFDIVANYDKMQVPDHGPIDTHINRDLTNW
jgi:hypothetical protein